MQRRTVGRLDNMTISHMRGYEKDKYEPDKRWLIVNLGEGVDESHERCHRLRSDARDVHGGCEGVGGGAGGVGAA